MKKALSVLIAALSVTFSAHSQIVTDTLVPGRPDPTLVSTREDGRQVSTYAIAHEMILNTEPAFAYRPGMNRRQFRKWQNGLSDAMASIMKFPDIKGQPAPVRVGCEQRDGYVLEKWEFYPLPGAVSTFLVLIPEGASSASPRPAMLCIPGSGVPKETLAWEKYPLAISGPGADGTPAPSTSKMTKEPNPKYAMALDYVREGYVAVCVDNAATGEAADHELDDNDDVTPSRLLLELGWSWLGYTSYLDMQVLQWMKTVPYMRKDRIVVSGFSLGTEPMMVLGALDRDIYAFVYNDFLCQTQERALVMTALREDGRRPFPNSIRHLIPDYWRYFNFPDVVASLAPRPVILTEGGLDRDFDLLRDAYATAGAPDAVSCNHYLKYADPKDRAGLDPLPGGVDRMTFFHLANVDTKNHYFKYEIVLPWLKKIL